MASWSLKRSVDFCCREIATIKIFHSFCVAPVALGLRTFLTICGLPRNYSSILITNSENLNEIINDVASAQP